MKLDAEVCIVGGGPSGMMLGLLLAGQGVDVTVLEKHTDFLRDFRGDTVPPSTLAALDELGLGAAATKVPHRDVANLEMTFADGTHRVADFGRLNVSHPYLRFMPQWDFLTILVEAAEPLPSFRLLREHEVVDLSTIDGVVCGVRAETSHGPGQGRPDGCRGRARLRGAGPGARAAGPRVRRTDGRAVVQARSRSPSGRRGAGRRHRGASTFGRRAGALPGRARPRAAQLRGRGDPDRADRPVEAMACARGVVLRVLEREAPIAAPPPLRLLRRFPRLQTVPARIIGLGLRPEHTR